MLSHSIGAKSSSEYTNLGCIYAGDSHTGGKEYKLPTARIKFPPQLLSCVPFTLNMVLVMFLSFLQLTLLIFSVIDGIIFASLSSIAACLSQPVFS